MCKVICEVSDRYLWALEPFAYLFNTFWSTLQPVTVFGYSRPNFVLPSNFSFYSIDHYNYPAERWSDGFISFLRTLNDDHFVLLLVDYWICRTVDVRGVASCFDYIRDKPNVLRLDLTDDRLFAGGVFDVEAYGSYDIIETPPSTPYQFSTQAGIWRRDLMLSLLEYGKTPWEVEIHTQVPSNMRVLGTRQSPVRYANAILKGQIDQKQLAKIPDGHRQRVLSMIPDGWNGQS